MELLQAAIPLILKTLVLSARWSGQIRLLKLQNLAKKNDQETEITFLQEEIYRLRIENEILRKQVHKSNKKPRYTLCMSSRNGTAIKDILLCELPNNVLFTFFCERRGNLNFIIPQSSTFCA